MPTGSGSTIVMRDECMPNLARGAERMVRLQVRSD